MSDNKTFQVSFLVSVLIHSVLFLGLPRMPFLPSRRALENVTITYYKIKETAKAEVVAKKVEPPVAAKLPEIKKEEILQPLKVAAKKPERVTAFKEPTDTKEAKRFEAVVTEEQNEARKATYISYYKAVRERIRGCADGNYPKNRNLGEGEAFLCFVVASSGELLQVKVVDEKSVNNLALRNIAVDSIRDASPFPPFPKGMSQYQITFNVIVSFESK